MKQWFYVLCVIHPLPQYQLVQQLINKTWKYCLIWTIIISFPNVNIIYNKQYYKVHINRNHRLFCNQIFWNALRASQDLITVANQIHIETSFSNCSQFSEYFENKHHNIDYQIDCALILYRIQRRNADSIKHHYDVRREWENMFGCTEIACDLVNIEER